MKIMVLLRKYIKPISESIISVVIGVIVGSIIILLAGYSPLVFYEALFSGSFKHTRAFLDTLSYMIPLTMTALSFAVAARASVFNIGAEGQMYMGALVANIVGTFFQLPRILHPFVAVIAAFLAGGFWGWLAGILKTKRKVNEVVSTIMLNWIAFYIVNYVSTYHIFDPKAPYKTAYVLKSSRFPPLVKGTSFTADFIVAISVAIVVFFLVWKTSLGYEIRAVGLNPTAAEYGGVNPEKIASIAMFIAGGCGGLAGAFLVLGRFGFITTTLTNVLNWGFDGIAVSLVGRNHPLGIIISSFFFAILNSGALEVQVATSKGGQIGVPYELVLAVMGIIVIAVSVPGLLDLIRARLRRVKGVEKVAMA